MQIIFSEMRDIFSRIKMIIDYKGISNNKFGRDIGCSSAQITQMLTHEKNFGIDKMLKILSAYPDISTEWLLTGQGEMLKLNSTKNGTTRPGDSLSKQPSRVAASGNKDNIIQENTQEKNRKILSVDTSAETYIIDTLMREMKEQKQEIKEQAREIGRLEAENKHLKEQLAEKNILSENVVEDASCAAAG
jgi:hypothetical protein